MYRFTQDVHSLGTGKDYRKGQVVPPEFPITDYMINAGVIEKVEIVPEKDKVVDAEVVSKAAGSVSKQSLENMTYNELGKLIKDCGLDFERGKDKRIASLMKYYQGSK